MFLKYKWVEKYRKLKHGGVEITYTRKKIKSLWEVI